MLFIVSLLDNMLHMCILKHRQTPIYSMLWTHVYNVLDIHTPLYLHMSLYTCMHTHVYTRVGKRFTVVST